MFRALQTQRRYCYSSFSLPFTIQQQHHSRRSYIFFPASWKSVQSSIQTWVGNKAKERTIWVKLLRENYRYRSNAAALAATLSLRYRPAWWVRYQRQKPPTTVLNLRASTYQYRASRHWWRHRRGLWMNQVRTRFRRTPSTVTETETPVQITEYSKSHWFDANGYPLTSRDESGRFVNPWSSQSTNGSHPLLEFLTWRLERLRVWNRRETIPLEPVTIDWKVYDNNNNKESNHHDHLSLTWIGHSTCLVRLSGYTLLTDPIFSHRASPVQWLPLGVPRHVPAACQVNDLPPVIDVVLVSHDHYDHLDKISCRLLKDRVQLWAVPSNIKEWLVNKCDIDPDKIIELEWWQQYTIPSSTNSNNTHSRLPLTLTCAPAQHWGSRTMWDRNQRLWCSWACQTPTRNFYFGGDTGYPLEFPLFRLIGDTLGPFDLSALPIGAYAPRFFMADSHVNPHEAVQIHEQIRSKQSVAIHWGTFALAEEDDDEPARLLQEANVEGFHTILPGETVVAHAVTTAVVVEPPNTTLMVRRRTKSSMRRRRHTTTLNNSRHTTGTTPLGQN